VRGNALLGMLVAVYDNDPYAHILPMHKVFSDIRTAMLLSDDLSVVNIKLPDCNRMSDV